MCACTGPTPSCRLLPLPSHDRCLTCLHCSPFPAALQHHGKTGPQRQEEEAHAAATKYSEAGTHAQEAGAHTKVSRGWQGRAGDLCEGGRYTQAPVHR